VELLPLLGGGGQERGWRSGTQALPAIAAFGVAAELAAAEMATETPRLISLRDRLFDLLADCPHLQPTGDRLHRLPHHVSFSIHKNPVLITTKSRNIASFKPDSGLAPAVLLKNETRPNLITGKAIVRQLNLAGIGISAGSACHSGKLSPSPILLAMGYTENEALTGIRLTLGHHTTQADIDWTATVLKQILERN
jgi:cysteine desulfurase